MGTPDARSEARLLAGILLEHVERIAEASVARMQELIPSYARVAREKLVPVTLANTRNLLEAIRDPDRANDQERRDYLASGAVRERQGITSDEMLHAWLIGLEGVREAAYAIADERDIPEAALLEFVEATLWWGDAGMRASAAAHHEAELREIGQLAREQAALRRVATMVAAERPPDEIFAKVAEEVGLVIGADSAAVWRYGQDVATVLAIWGNQGDVDPVGSRWSMEGDSTTAVVYRTGQPARFDGFNRARGPLADHGESDGMRSSVGSPIVVGGRVWGSLVAASRVEALPADAEARLAQFTELMATAISNLQARAEVQRLADQQAALWRVATMVARERPAAELFARIVEELGRLLDVESVGLERYEPGGEAIIVGHWGVMAREIPVGTRIKLDGLSVAALVYRNQRPARFGLFEEAEGELARRAHAAGLRSAVGTPIFVNQRLWGAIVAGTSRPDAIPDDAESRIAQFAELVATAVSNLEARDEVQRLAEEQAALRRVATMVARESAAEDLLAQIAEEVGQLLRVESVSIARFEPEGDRTIMASWGPLRHVLAVGNRETLAFGSANLEVFRTGRPARFDGDEGAWGSATAAARRLGLRSSVASPIHVDGRLWGAIVAGTSRPDGMPGGAESRIAQFTELAATAISNVQARSDLAESRARIVEATDEERRRVVRDLHDGAQQRLVHTMVTLRLVRDALGRDEQEAAALLSEATQHATSANAELRELAHGILPSILTTGGLAAGVNALVARISIPVEVTVSVDRLSPAVEATAYLTIAESLTNVVKHAYAGRATVRVEAANGAVEVEIRDDGVGGARLDGPGLLGLRDRVAALDGQLRVESPRAGGTRVAASIPAD